MDLVIQDGVKAAMWTDVLRTTVVLISLLAAIIQGLITVDLFKRPFSITAEPHRIVFDKCMLSSGFVKNLRSIILSDDSVCFNPCTRKAHDKVTLLGRKRIANNSSQFSSRYSPRSSHRCLLLSKS